MIHRLVLFGLLLLVSCDKPADTPTAVAAQGERFSRKTAKTLDVGTFEVISDQLIASDPGYPAEEAGLHGLARPARRGTWKATVIRIDTGNGDHRNAELWAIHAGAKAKPDWKKRDGALGVDSGQLGIFDRSTYYDPGVVPKDYKWKDKPVAEDLPWYSLCCEQTLADPGAGVIPHGAVTHSGFGDGAYEWYAWGEKDEVVGVRVVFLPE